MVDQVSFISGARSLNEQDGPRFTINLDRLIGLSESRLSDWFLKVTQ
jgi:hypothetical protein